MSDDTSLDPLEQRRRDETDLLSRIASGCGGALEELSRRYGATVLSAARGVLNDPADADDVLQDVLWKVWSHAGQFDARRASLTTWLTVLSRRAAIDRLRQRQRRQRLASELPPESPAAAPEVAESVLLRSRFVPVRRALRSLPREQRQVLELGYFRDLSQREIANLVGIPLGTVKTRTNLAIQRLRRALASAPPAAPAS